MIEPAVIIIEAVRVLIGYIQMRTTVEVEVAVVTVEALLLVEMVAGVMVKVPLTVMLVQMV
jgi:hypothetical protein